MFKLFAIIASIALATAANVDLETYTFEQYVADYNLKYSAEEMPLRRTLFENEVKRIRVHNSKNLGWTEGITKFTTMTAAEKKAFKGRVKGLSKGKLRALPDDFTIESVDKLPRSVDWRNAGIVSAVKDQGYCGSCWAFASTAVIESHVAKATGLLFDLSVQQIAMCSPNVNHCGGDGGCAGATAELAFDYVTNSGGLFEEYQYSYQSYYGKNYACANPAANPVATINGYVQLPENNYAALMNAIAKVGPVAISVDASSWSPYKGGIFDGCNQVNPDIDHAVVLVGYGEDKGKKYWLVRNSWSPAWGEKGYIRLARTDDEQGRCGSDITPTDGTACNGNNTAVTVCGTCGILYDSAYPLNPTHL